MDEILTEIFEVWLSAVVLLLLSISGGIGISSVDSSASVKFSENVSCFNVFLAFSAYERMSLQWHSFLLYTRENCISVDFSWLCNYDLLTFDLIAQPQHCFIQYRK